MKNQINLLLFSKRKNFDFQRLKVKAKKSGQNKTDVLLLARSKAVCEDGRPSYTIPINKLSLDNKDVINGVIVDSVALRRYGEYDYKKINKHNYDYSKRLSVMRYPMDDLITKSTIHFDNIIDLIKSIVLSKYSKKQLYSLFVKNDNKPLTLSIRGVGIIPSDIFIDDVKRPNDGFIIPQIKIYKVERVEDTRLIPNHKDVSTIETISKSHVIKNKKSNDFAVVTQRTTWDNKSPIIVDGYKYDFRIDGNTIRKFKNILNNINLITL